MKRVKCALTVAGSDSGGGAGISADLRTFSVFGVHPLVAITAITAQNTKEVRSIFQIPPEVLRAQLEAIFDDFNVSAAKTGMLLSSELIEVVAEFFGDLKIPLVIDPVLRASTGAELLREDGLRALKEKLIPLSFLITPNIPEAEILSGVKIRNSEDMKNSARAISEELGARAVLIKGGHLGGDATDLLYFNETFRFLHSPRVSGCSHGTGCTLSAGITALLAKGFELEEAVRRAKEFTRISILHGSLVGSGNCPVNPLSWLEIPAERWKIFEEILNHEEFLRGKFSEYFSVVSRLPGFFSDDFLELRFSERGVSISLNSEIARKVLSRSTSSFAVIMKPEEISEESEKKFERFSEIQFFNSFDEL